ncbi:MAG: hypothetical protein K2K38_02455 [Clostridia bacterium]|nr:hypothetical protein [Clostridia bacterium]
MRKVLNFVNDNKKIIIVVILIIVLVGTIYFINKAADKSTATNASADKSATEVKLTGILSSIDGVGATDVMINEGDKGVLGVVIVCEGANNIMTRNNILNAVSTALNIDKNLIAIYSMNN